MTVIDAFWEDLTPTIRRLVLDEAAGRTAGCIEFNFDVFDVELDFEDE